jgi:hypothetical protein
MAKLSIVTSIFQDLEEAFRKLSAQNTSPRQVRRNLENFVVLAWKLTQSMYKEYRARTGEKWKADTFAGWNEVSELFAELRRIDQHEPPVRMHVNETRYYKIAEDTPDLLAFSFDWGMDLDFLQAEKPPDGVRLVPRDPETGGPSFSKEFVPARIEYEFHLQPSTKKLRVLLDSIGDPEIRRLTARYFEIVTEYYRYYQHQLARHREKE